jgi:pimeloyl-ACP methyl ester carboxylesterase
MGEFRTAKRPFGYAHRPESAPRNGHIVSSRLVSFHWIVLVAISAALLAAPASRAAPPTVLQEQIAPYLTPQHLVHIAKGRAINLVCLGHGSPTVILASGGGGWSLSWWRVQPVLAQRTRTCAWDPAGFGFSGPSPEPQDTEHATLDLERVLKAAGVQGPYVVVGHSLGGYIALRFTDLHRRSVAGMVLVDPSIPDQDAVIERIAPKAAAIEDPEQKRLRECAAALRSGTLRRGTPQFKQCTAPVNFPANLPAAFSALKAALTQLNADHPARLLTQDSQLENFGRSSRQVINPRRRYGDLPLIVLTAGRDELPPNYPAEVREQTALFYRDAWVPAHDAYAALSTRGRNQLVPDSEHAIQFEKPAVVISAVIKVLDEIRPSALHEP